MNEPSLELGAWLGRSQAFRLIACHCSAVDAQCLRNIKDGGAYKSFSPSWGEFCDTYIGIHRTTADRIIEQLEEFGASYFKLSEIMRITPATYGHIASAVSEETIECGGQKIPINRDNAVRIKQAVEALRRAARPPRDCPARIQAAVTRINNCVALLSSVARIPLNPEHRATVEELLRTGARKLTELADRIPPISDP